MSSALVSKDRLMVVEGCQNPLILGIYKARIVKAAFSGIFTPLNVTSAMAGRDSSRSGGSSSPAFVWSLTFLLSASKSSIYVIYDGILRDVKGYFARK